MCVPQQGDEYGDDTPAVVQTALEARYLENPQMGAMHDNAACSALNPFASGVVKVEVAWLSVRRGRGATIGRGACDTVLRGHGCMCDGLATNHL